MVSGTAELAIFFTKTFMLFFRYIVITRKVKKSVKPVLLSHMFPTCILEHLNKFPYLFWPTCGGGGREGGTIYSNGFFVQSLFGRSIYSSQKIVIVTLKKTVQRRIWN